MSTRLFIGILCFSAALSAQIPPDPRAIQPFEFGPTSAESAPGLPAVPDSPEPPEPKPISGVVSLRELQHPVSKKALRAAYEAQQLANARNIPKARKTARARTGAASTTTTAALS